MSLLKNHFKLACLLALAGFAALAPLTGNAASTIWAGPLTNYSHTTSTSKDQITNDVALTRGANHPLFNSATPFSESFYDGSSSPHNTEWAMGTLTDLTNGTLTFDKWANVIGGGGTYGPGGLASFLTDNPNYVMHIVSKDIYLSVHFNSWSPGGNYSYSRSTPSAVAPPPPTPTVTLTNPTAGLVLSAPATLHLGANAAVTGGGSVTNVTFFASTGGAPTAIGTAVTSPFNVNSTSLSAGSYSLTAVATAAGISGTSAPVNISIVTAVAVSNTAPIINAHHFNFSYTANTGLTYVIQRSTDLIIWTPVLTNVASSGTVPFTDTATVGSDGFYRVVRQANP